MNDAELDKKLKTGRDEAEHFFAAAAMLRGRRPVAACRPVVRPHARLRAFGAFALAALVVAAALFAMGALRSDWADTADTDANAQMVYLGADKQYRVSSIPVNMPDDAGLMMVLWEMHEGSDEMAYYSLFETCDVAYPAQTLSYPGSGHAILLLASADSEAGSLGYRLVGYSGDALTDWWVEDDVQDGSVTLQGGVVVERRLQPSGKVQTVTYIVPVQVSSPGAVELPVDTLHMNVGERILLIGTGEMELITDSGLLKAQEQPTGTGMSAVLMRATSSGSDVLHLGEDEDAQTLSVEIEG